MTKTTTAKASKATTPKKPSRSGKRPTGEAVPMEILGDDIAPWDTYIMEPPAPPDVEAAALTLHLDTREATDVQAEAAPPAEPEAEAERAAHEPDAGGSGAPVATTDTPRRRRQPRHAAKPQQGAAKALCPVCASWSRKQRSFISPAHTDWRAYLKRYTNPAKWTPTEADIEWLAAHARAAAHEALAAEAEAQS